MDRFWASSENKVLIQAAMAEFLKTVTTNRDWETILSGVLLDGGPTPAVSIQDKRFTEISQTLKVAVEEADIRIIPHVFHAVKHGMQRVVVLSNDTDVFVLLIHFYKILHENGLSELWMRKSSSDIIPIHTLVNEIDATADVVLAAHFLTRSDVTSKIGNKVAALKAEPEKYLCKFGRSLPPSAKCLELAEEYLVKVVKLGSRSKTFDTLRFEIMNLKSLHSCKELPCTSSSLQGHLKRSFYMVYSYSTVLNAEEPLDPTDFGWTYNADDSLLTPDASINELPEDVVSTCTCKSCSTRRCKCLRKFISCTTFCKCKTICNNQERL